MLKSRFFSSKRAGTKQRNQPEMNYKNKIVGNGKRFVNQFKKKLQHKVCTTKLLDEDDDP